MAFEYNSGVPYTIPFFPADPFSHGAFKANNIPLEPTRGVLADAGNQELGFLHSSNVHSQKSKSSRSANLGLGAKPKRKRTSTIRVRVEPPSNSQFLHLRRATVSGNDTHLSSPSLSLPAFFSSLPLSPSTPTAPYRTASKDSRLVQHLLRTYKLPTKSQYFWLSLYFIFNLGLTLLNKFVLVQFPFPYTVTAVHALGGTVGCWPLRRRGIYSKKKLDQGESLIILGFSLVYAVNIAVSNASLQLVTVPFHQVVRATTPIFTLILSATLTGTRFSLGKVATLFPVVIGVVFAAYGDLSYTTWGFALTFIGAILAAVKGILTNALQSKTDRPCAPMPATPNSTGLKACVSSPSKLHLALHPLDLLSRLSTLACIQCLVFARVSGELDMILSHPSVYLSSSQILALGLNGFIAFGLNVVSFYANGKTSPVSMSVAANIKQVLTILFAVFFFELSLSPLNSLGIFLSLVGGAWYGRLEYNEKSST